MSRNRAERTIEDLSPKEKDFCKYYCEIGGDNYCNKSGAAKAAGYTSNPSAAAARMLKRPAVKALCKQMWQDNCDKYNITPHRVLSDLEHGKFLSLKKGDMTNFTRNIELIGKHLAMFREAFVFESIEAFNLSEATKDEARRIARVLNLEEARRGKADGPDAQPQVM